MTAFKFRLETLLKLHLAERDRRRVVLAANQAALDQANSQLATAEEEIRSVRQKSAGGLGRIDMTSLRASDDYLSQLRAEFARIAAQHSLLAEQVSADRESLIAADREVRALEKLRAQRQSTFQAHEQRREQREIEEVAAFAAQHRLDI